LSKRLVASFLDSALRISERGTRLVPGVEFEVEVVNPPC
jgi:hypothetical protein